MRLPKCKVIRRMINNKKRYYYEHTQNLRPVPDENWTANTVPIDDRKDTTADDFFSKIFSIDIITNVFGKMVVAVSCGKCTVKLLGFNCSSGPFYFSSGSNRYSSSCHWILLFAGYIIRLCSVVYYFYYFFWIYQRWKCY